MINASLNKQIIATIWLRIEVFESTDLIVLKVRYQYEADVHVEAMIEY